MFSFSAFIGTNPSNMNVFWSSPTPTNEPSIFTFFSGDCFRILARNHFFCSGVASTCSILMYSSIEPLPNYVIVNLV